MSRNGDQSVEVNRSKGRAVADEYQRLRKAAQRRIMQQPRQVATNRLESTNPELVLAQLFAPFGLRTGSAEAYIPVPADPARQRHNDWGGLCWRIELRGLPGRKSLGFDILGDVVLGRGQDPSCLPDIDLDPFGGLEKGVSRQHALLRPTQLALYLLDLGSTNGVRYNMLLVSSGVAHSITNNDTISLGNLTFDVKIVDGPPLWKTH